MTSLKKKIDVVSHATKLASDVNISALQEIAKLIKSKMVRIQSIIQRILQTLNSYRGLNIISNSDLIVCTSTLIECFEKSSTIMSQLENVSYPEQAVFLPRNFQVVRVFSSPEASARCHSFLAPTV